jgi:hypothetical protein
MESLKTGPGREPDGWSNRLRWLLGLTFIFNVPCPITTSSHPGLSDAVAAVTHHYVFLFLTNAVAAYLMPLELLKYERLVLVRNGEKIALWAASEFCSSFDPKIFFSGNFSAHSTV